MYRPRIIPVLLLNNKTLVKSQRFKNYRYIGDPINAVRIFNELQADELIFLDIAATKNKRAISLRLVEEIAEEAMIPFSVGGGIRELFQIKEIICLGVEKVVIGSYAVVNPDFVKLASREFGSSTISVCIDIGKHWLGKEQVWSVNGTKPSGINPLQFAQLMERNGAGEVIIQSIENDGKMQGYNLNLIKEISSQLSIPTVALGGAGCMEDLRRVYYEANVAGTAAGSLFVYCDKGKGVLINYPEKEDIKTLYDH